MKRHRYHTERRSKKLSPDRREALDEQCKWSNQQPMSSIYDLKDRKSTDWSHAVRLLDDPSPEVYLTGPAKKLEALMHRRGRNIERILDGTIETFAAKEKPNPNGQGRKKKKASPEDTKRYKEAAKERKAAAAQAATFVPLADVTPSETTLRSPPGSKGLLPSIGSPAWVEMMEARAEELEQQQQQHASRLAAASPSPSSASSPGLASPRPQQQTLAGWLPAAGSADWFAMMAARIDQEEQQQQQLSRPSLPSASAAIISSSSSSPPPPEPQQRITAWSPGPYSSEWMAIVKKIEQKQQQQRRAVKQGHGLAKATVPRNSEALDAAVRRVLTRLTDGASSSTLMPQVGGQQRGEKRKAFSYELAVAERAAKRPYKRDSLDSSASHSPSKH